MSWLICHLYESEAAVGTRMVREGFGPFLPLYWHTDAVQRVLYPEYIFVQHEPRWPSLTRIDGVVRVLGEEDNPCLIPRTFIDSIKAASWKPDGWEGVGAVRLASKTTDTFKAGDMVRITAGPHQGLVGEYHEGKTKYGRSKVYLDYMGGRRLISVPTQLLASPPAVLDGHEAAECVAFS